MRIFLTLTNPAKNFFSILPLNYRLTELPGFISPYCKTPTKNYKKSLLLAGFNIFYHNKSSLFLAAT